ncbi:MAG: hypothetical protein FWF82_02555 [Oscillospiraceae bacterium]|nr:hypothetical protein [Oscillospiraceae bacterium]
MAWIDAVITNAGAALLSSAMQDGIVITKVLGGSGTYNLSSLMAQTNVTAPRTNLPIAGIKELEKSRQVDIRIDNRGLNESYTLRQVGIWARRNVADSAEVMLAIIQDDKGEEIPAESLNPEFILEFGFILPISNTLEVRVELDTSVLATVKGGLSQFAKSPSGRLTWGEILGGSQED